MRVERSLAAVLGLQHLVVGLLLLGFVELAPALDDLRVGEET